MLERSRLLDVAWFEVSVGLYRQYLQETTRGQNETPVGPFWNGVENSVN